MNSDAKPCPVCHGGVRQAGKTTFTADLGFGVIVIRGVPAQVCDLCGADWIEDNVAEKLEQVVNQAKQKHSAVEVTYWNDEVTALAS